MSTVAIEPSSKFTFSNSRLNLIGATAGAKAVWVYDDKTEGLALAVGKTGKTFFYKRWIEKGKVEKKLGRFSVTAAQSADFEANPLCVLANRADLTTDQARAVVRAINGEFAAGRNPFVHAVDLKEQRRAELNVGEMFQIYIEKHYTNKRKRLQDTLNDYRRDCEIWSKRPLSSISHTETMTWHDQLSKTRGKYTANRRVQLMRAIYNKATLWRLYSGHNPFKGITLNDESPREFALTTAQAGKLWATLSSDSNLMIRDYGRLLLATGARRSELCAMRWEDLNLSDGIWRIPAKDTKTKESRLVALGAIEIEILNERKKTASGAYVFPSKDGKSHLTEPKKSWDRIRKKAGVPECTLHDCRRSVGSALAANGVDPKTIQGALGHKDMKTTLRHYVVSGLDLQREAKQVALGKWLEKASKGAE